MYRGRIFCGKINIEYQEDSQKMKKNWWKESIVYQIYPKSFNDSNSDGIGDIRGIIEKLDYLKELGVNVLWISPMLESPQDDNGYDISDYYNIHPAFGTLDDMDRLLTEARKRDMYILLDLVVNHCSDEHEWFEKACADPDGKYGNALAKAIHSKPCLLLASSVDFSELLF